MISTLYLLISARRENQLFSVQENIYWNSKIDLYFKIFRIHRLIVHEANAMFDFGWLMLASVLGFGFVSMPGMDSEKLFVEFWQMARAWLKGVAMGPWVGNVR